LPPAEPKATIAVIDDDEMICRLVVQLLESDGYRAKSTTDPTAAHDLVRADRPNLVLCDIAMPVMDGYAVLKKLQSDPETAAVPVVFFTAQSEFTERVRAFRFGVVDFIAKPFRRELLLRRVERLLAGLPARPGRVSAEITAGGAQELLESAQRESRSGVLSVLHAGRPSHTLIQAGEVVEGTPPSDDSLPAEFCELDPSREQIVSPTESSGPEGEEPLSFDSVPEVLRTVLIADDDDIFRRFLQNLLQAQAFRVLTASDGAQALELALEQRPWLILTDVRMPGVDGIELCRRVRAHSLIRHTPVVFLSGWDDYKARYSGLEAGGDDFLSKRTPVRELLIRIKLILQRFAELGGRGAAAASAGMEGRLDLVSSPGLLQMCHLGRLTGTLVVRSGSRACEVGFGDGEIVSLKGDGIEGIPALHEVLGWTRGLFAFTPGQAVPGPALGESFDQLLLEGCRWLDEQRR
jgi:DNA-binding response OmpR family regulator